MFWVDSTARGAIKQVQNYENTFHGKKVGVYDILIPPPILLLWTFLFRMLRWWYWNLRLTQLSLSPATLPHLGPGLALIVISNPFFLSISFALPLLISLPLSLSNHYWSPSTPFLLWTFYPDLVDGAALVVLNLFHHAGLSSFFATHRWFRAARNSVICMRIWPTHCPSQISNSRRQNWIQDS